MSCERISHWRRRSQGMNFVGALLLRHMPATVRAHCALVGVLCVVCVCVCCVVLCARSRTVSVSLTLAQDAFWALAALMANYSLDAVFSPGLERVGVCFYQVCAALALGGNVPALLFFLCGVPFVRVAARPRIVCMMCANTARSITGHGCCCARS